VIKTFKLEIIDKLAKENLYSKKFVGMVLMMNLI